MPWWPIMMPSEAVGAPKTCGTPPAARTPSQPLRASRSRWALQGVMSLKSEATPTIGRVKSSSRKPTARSMARLGARHMASVVSRLRRLPSGGMTFPLLFQVPDDRFAVGDQGAFLQVARAGIAPEDLEHFEAGP